MADILVVVQERDSEGTVMRLEKGGCGWMREDSGAEERGWKESA